MRSITVFIALVLALQGCGGSDGDADSPAPATTTPAGTVGPSTTGSSIDFDDGSDMSPLNCPELLNWAMDSVSAASAAFSGGSSAGGVEFTADYFQEFADRAPAEIRSDMQLFADAFGEFWETLEDLGFDYTDPQSMASMDQATIAELESAAALLDTDEVQQAADNIAAFFERECS